MPPCRPRPAAGTTSPVVGAWRVARPGVGASSRSSPHSGCGRLNGAARAPASVRWSGGSTVARETFGAVARKHTSTTVRFAPSDSAELERIGPNDIVSTADERDSSDLQQTESVQDDSDLAALSRGPDRSGTCSEGSEPPQEPSRASSPKHDLPCRVLLAARLVPGHCITRQEPWRLSESSDGRKLNV